MCIYLLFFFLSRCSSSPLGSPFSKTLLDALKEGNDETSEKIGAIRKKTRDRKREMAEERRAKALVGMSAFGTLAGSAVSDSRPAAAVDSADNRTTSMLASMFGLSAFASVRVCLQFILLNTNLFLNCHSYQTEVTMMTMMILMMVRVCLQFILFLCPFHLATAPCYDTDHVLLF